MSEKTLDTRVSPNSGATRVIESIMDKKMSEETLDTRVSPT